MMQSQIFSTDLFSKLNEEEKKILTSIIKEKSLKKGEMLCLEGDASDDLYFVMKGSLEILKKDAENREFSIKTLHTGELVGEFSILDHKPRSASIRAVENVTVQSINIATLKQFESIFTKVQIGLNQLFAQRLSITNLSVVENMKKELESKQITIEIGRFSVMCILLVCFYSFTLRILTTFFPDTPTSNITIPVILIYGAILVYFTKRSHYPISYFGVTTKNIGKSLRVGFLASIPFLLIMFGYKIWYAHVNSLPLSSILEGYNFFITPRGMTLGLIYILLCPIQEFMTRGVCQTSFYQFISGSEKAKGFQANLLANSVFTVAHLHYPFPIPFYVFSCGMLWGWIYTKEKNLAGAILSHILVGFSGQFILDFPDLCHFLKF